MQWKSIYVGLKMRCFISTANQYNKCIVRVKLASLCHPGKLLLCRRKDTVNQILQPQLVLIMLAAIHEEEVEEVRSRLQWPESLHVIIDAPPSQKPSLHSDVTVGTSLDVGPWPAGGTGVLQITLTEITATSLRAHNSSYRETKWQNGYFPDSINS